MPALFNRTMLAPPSGLLTLSCSRPNRPDRDGYGDGGVKNECLAARLGNKCLAIGPKAFDRARRLKVGRLTGDWPLAETEVLRAPLEEMTHRGRAHRSQN